MRVSTVFKIRFLLVVLTMGFFITALTIRLTYTQQEVLLHDGKKIERNLQKKEKRIHEFLRDSLSLTKLAAAASGDGLAAEKLIAHFTKKHQIFVYLFQGSSLVFWSTEQFVPSNANLLLQSSTIIRVGNGWYRVLRHRDGKRFGALFLIPIKSEFQKENAYLENQFSRDLIRTDNLDIAEYNDRQVYNVRDSEGQYLFSVKLNATKFEGFYSDLEMLMWVLGGFFSVVLLQLACLCLARSRYPWLSILLFGIGLLGMRWVELSLGWFSSNFHNALFDPRYYASSRWFPHLGGFMVNLALMTWLSAYIFSIRKRLWIPRIFYTKWGSGTLLVSFVLILYAICGLLSNLFSNLISHSDINFDVTDILNLDQYGWLGVFALCLGMTILSLHVGWMVFILHAVIPRRKKRLTAIVSVMLLSFFVLALIGKFDVYVLLVGAFFLIRALYVPTTHKFGIAVIISSLLLMSGLTALKHAEFHQIKRQEAQKRAILKLEAVDDASALSLFVEIENELTRDTVLYQLFQDPSTYSRETLDEHLKKSYFSGYLSKYDVVAEVFDARFRALSPSPRLDLNAYRDKVISGANMVSRNFYRERSNNYGNFRYFAQFPFYAGDQILGVLLIDLRNRLMSQSANYPGVLADSRLDQRPQESVSYYASAFYRDGKLVNQFGRYVYPTTDSVYLPAEVRQFKSLGRTGGFSHIAYKPDQNSLIVLGKPELSIWMQLAAVSFFFLVYMLFFLLVFLFSWLITTLNAHGFSLRNLRWSYLVQTNRILYSTRIQTFIVTSVVFTLITAGMITYFSLSRQFQDQQERTLAETAWELAKNMELSLLGEENRSKKSWKEDFLEVAKSNAVDLNVYDTGGKLIYTTQPRIFDLELISQQINAEAFVHLNHYGRTRYVHREQIGELNYMSAYVSLRDGEYKPLAFLALPNYSSQLEFDQNLGVLLNTIINIYALVILILGLFAVFVANKITAPLLLVQRSLARTKIGKQNEPIFWKRNDEIGSLIREYNFMIAELEQSAERLMQSERESAWKEMAKQVAHEIKNPLTPLKLGIQQLERSWKDQDPRFEARFQRFIVSFVEQIDSLTRIATEFSDFAKMPDANYVVMDLEEVIRNSVAVFDHLSNVSIQIHNLVEGLGEEGIQVKGDKDQLLRTFNNLIKNSIEAAVGKRRCQINITLNVDGDFALVDVRDNGQGISAEARKRLFQPNFTTKSSGTGLGLAFVKRAIEAIGGTIHFESEMGRGTVFYIRIPLHRDGSS